MITRILMAAAVAIGFPALAAAQAKGGAELGGAKLEVRTKQPYGQYLTDGEGRALYMFVEDEPGASSCYDACAEVWPPFITSERPRKGDAVREAMVDTIRRKDGRLQVTYDSMPLYYYVKDQGPGSTTGQDVTDRFGEWYLVAPSGETIEVEKKG